LLQGHDSVGLASSRENKVSREEDRGEMNQKLPGADFCADLTFDREAGTATLSWLGVAGRRYEVWFGDNLNASMQLYRVVPSAGDGVTKLTVPLAAARGLFQVRMVLPEGR
jgi:hypothetical protein